MTGIANSFTAMLKNATEQRKKQNAIKPKTTIPSANSHLKFNQKAPGNPTGLEPSSTTVTTSSKKHTLGEESSNEDDINDGKQNINEIRDSKSKLAARKNETVQNDEDDELPKSKKFKRLKKDNSDEGSANLGNDSFVKALKKNVKEKELEHKNADEEIADYEFEENDNEDDKTSASNSDNGSLSDFDDDDAKMVKDVFGEEHPLVECRACKEVFFTSKNYSKISRFIDDTLDKALHCLSLDAIINTIYEKVEKSRLKYNSKEPDKTKHIEQWSRELIKVHLAEHMVRLDIQQKVIHENLNAMLSVAASNIKLQHPETGATVFNHKAVDSCLKIQKAIKDNTTLNAEASYTYVANKKS